MKDSFRGIYREDGDGGKAGKYGTLIEKSEE